MEIQAPTPEMVTAAVDRIAASRIFAKSGRHKSLLRYLVEKTVAGKVDEVKEYTVALEVFGREVYDPHVDSQVRVEVGKLRERLEKYYSADGSMDTIRIEIPKGSYAAVFRNTAPESPPVAAPAEPAPIRKSGVLYWGLAVAGTALAVTGLMRMPQRTPMPVAKAAIAILPFEDLSPGKDQEYFCNGMTEELVSNLTRLEIFRVLPRSSVVQYKGHLTDARSIGEQLHVQAVVEGTVRKDGENIRVSVRLIDTREGFQLWAQTYDRQAGRILETQREIAESVVKAFHLDLSETRRALVRQRTRSVEAYLQYLRAAHHIGEPDEAIVFYRAAIAADPDYALAWAGLATAWNRLFDWQQAPLEKAHQEASRAAAKALSLDPELAEAQHAWGMVKLFYERDWQAAEQALKRAVELDPANIDHRWEYARLILTPTKRFRESADVTRSALALEPFKSTLHDQLASNFLKARQFEAAIAPLQAARKIAPRAPAPIVQEGIAAASQGRYEEALLRFEEAARIRRSVWVLSHIGFALGKLARADEARTILREIQLNPLGAPSTEFELAAVYAGLGERERALTGLERAASGFSMAVLWINVDYRLDDLRKDPRFVAVVGTVGLKE